MSNTSGRVTDLETELDFPGGEGWLREFEKRNSEGNAKRKRIALEQFDRYCVEEGLRLDDVGDRDLELFSYWLDDEGLAHSTIPGRWYDVRKYLNQHFDEDVGWLDPDAGNAHVSAEEWILEWLDEGTQTVGLKDDDIHWLPQEDIQKLIDGAKNLKNRLVIELLWNTGCRPSEVARMKKRRVTRDSRSIRVETSKRDNHTRTVFYSRSMRRTMREWLDRGGRASMAFASESPFLVVGYNTPGVQARQINEIVRMAADEAGIQEVMIPTAGEDGEGNPIENNRVVPKTLRHSFAVHSVRGVKRSGTPPIDIERLSRIMGHSSLESTREYLKFRTSDLRDAYDSSFPG